MVVTFLTLGSGWIYAEEAVFPQVQSNSPLVQQDAFTMAAPEIKCLLKSEGIDEQTASKTSDVLARALPKIQLDGRKFNRISFLHFLAQIKSESGAGQNETQIGDQPPNKKGYGLNQVTGFDNLEDCAKCMNQVQPGLGDGVVQSPETTVGAHGDPYKSAMISLCWWRNNIVNNSRNDSICLQPTGVAVIDITQISNSGHIGGKVTGGEASLDKREDSFQKLLAAQCQGS